MAATKKHAPPAPVPDRGEGSPAKDLVDELVARAAGAADRAAGPLLGEVVDDRHPTLLGRVRVQWTCGDDVQERWLPTLMGLSLRKGDRVLVLRAENFEEPVVVGVLDGFRDRPPVERHPGARVSLKDDEVVRVAAEDGTGLLEVFRGDRGPILRLLEADVDVELPGRLRMSARSIELQARRGKVRVEASDDVVVRGEAIHLN